MPTNHTSSSSPEVWFVIPSASPEKCRKVLPIWQKMGYRTAVLQNFEKGDIPADLTVWSDTYPGWPSSVNWLCKNLLPTDCNLIVTGGDDMLPDPNHSAAQLADQFFSRFPDSFGVMQPHADEYLASRRYCGSPFLGRAFFSSMYQGTGPMFPNYHHNWADNELFWVAKAHDALWLRNDLSHYHDHFTRGRSNAQPAYWTSVKQRDLDDCLLYFARAQTGFAGSTPLDTPTSRNHPFNPDLIDKAEAVILAKQRLMGIALDNPYAQALSQALHTCHKNNQHRVAIFGLGAHTRIAAPALFSPPVEICCIIDDNPAHHNTRAWNIPVVSQTKALELNPDAVILSAAAVEDELWQSSEPLRTAGIPVIRLYTVPPIVQRTIGAS